MNALVAVLLLVLAYLFASEGSYFFAAVPVIALVVLAISSGRKVPFPKAMQASDKAVAKQPDLAAPGSYAEPTENLAKNAGRVVSWPLRMGMHFLGGKHKEGH